jgi:DoxX-like family
MRENDSSQPNWMTWSGRAMSGLAVAFLLFDGVLKLLNPAVVQDSLAGLGYAPSLGIVLGVLTLVPTLLYAWPRTSLLGAVLLTGLLGGAIAAQLRVGSPLLSHLLFGVYLGLFVWGGLWLRTPALRAMLPLGRGGGNPLRAEPTPLVEAARG